jgi:uncharacterized membrane protein
MLDSLVKWLHLLATVAWIGSMFAGFIIYLPAISKQLDPPAAGKLMGAAMKRTRIMVYVSISIFVISGVRLVSMHGMMYGRMYVGDSWFLFFLGKMLLFAIMVLLAVYAFEILAPRVARLAAEGPSPRLKRLQKQQQILALAGFVLGLVILFLSASL